MSDSTLIQQLDGGSLTRTLNRPDQESTDMPPQYPGWTAA